MLIGILLGFLRSRLRAFSGSERGNVMATFALASIPMIGFVGAAVDYSRGNSAKVAMQSAIDATALMLSKDAQKLTTLSSREGRVHLYRAASPARCDRPYRHADLQRSRHGKLQADLGATGKVPTSFTKVIGQE